MLFLVAFLTLLLSCERSPLDAAQRFNCEPGERAAQPLASSPSRPAAVKASDPPLRCRHLAPVRRSGPHSGPRTTRRASAPCQTRDRTPNRGNCRRRLAVRPPPTAAGTMPVRSRTISTTSTMTKIITTLRSARSAESQLWVKIKYLESLNALVPDRCTSSVSTDTHGSSRSDAKELTTKR